jgi:hypothetical protein
MKGDEEDLRLGVSCRIKGHGSRTMIEDMDSNGDTGWEKQNAIKLTASLVYQ